MTRSHSPLSLAVTSVLNQGYDGAKYTRAIPRNRTITPQDITIMEGIFTYASGDTDATGFRSGVGNVVIAIDQGVEDHAAHGQIGILGSLDNSGSGAPQDITIMEGIFTYASGDTDATDFDVKGSVYAGTNNSSDANVNRNKDLVRHHSPG